MLQGDCRRKCRYSDKDGILGLRVKGLGLDLRWNPIVAIRDSMDYIRVLLFFHYYGVGGPPMLDR